MRYKRLKIDHVHLPTTHNGCNLCMSYIETDDDGDDIEMKKMGKKSGSRDRGTKVGGERQENKN